MNTFSAGEAKIYDSTVSDFISRKHQRFAEVLADYNESLSLEFVPSMARDEDDTKPFRIVENTPERGRQVVKYLTERELDDPEAILLWIWEGDFRKHSPDAIFNRLEAKRLASEILKQKQEDDEREERVDLLANLVSGGRDRKHFFRHGGQTFRR